MLPMSQIGSSFFNGPISSRRWRHHVFKRRAWPAIRTRTKKKTLRKVFFDGGPKSVINEDRVRLRLGLGHDLRYAER